MKSHERLSNAFSKLTNRIKPSILNCSHPNIRSYIILVQSEMLRPSRNPFCSRLIILFKTFLRRVVRTEDIILYVVFKRDMGRQFFIKFRGLPGLGRQVMSPCVMESVRQLLMKHSFMHSRKKWPNWGQNSFGKFGTIAI